MDTHTQLGTPRRDLIKGAAGVAAGVAAASLLTGGGTVSAANGTTMSLTIDGIGTSGVIAYSWGASNSSSLHVGGGGGAGRANFQDLSITRYSDTLSPKLMRSVATGSLAPRAMLTVTPKSGPSTTYELKPVLVTSVSLGGHDGEGALTENVSLNFAEFTYTVGGESFTFNVSTNA